MSQETTGKEARELLEKYKKERSFGFENLSGKCYEFIYKV